MCVDRLGFEAGAAARRRLRTLLFVGLFAQGPGRRRRRLRPACSARSPWTRSRRWTAISPAGCRRRALAVAGPALVALAVLLVDPLAAALLVVAGLLVPVGMAVAGIGAAAASRNQFVAMGRLQARFLDRVRGIATIVLAGQAEAEARRLQEAAEELTRRTMRVLRVAFLSSAFLDAAAAASFVLLAIRFGLAERAGTIADPAVALFPLLLVAEFFAPLRAFAAAYQDRLHSVEAAEQLAAAEPAAAAAAGQAAGADGQRDRASPSPSRTSPSPATRSAARCWRGSASACRPARRRSSSAPPARARPR